MASEDSYVVRIYRRTRDPVSLTGIVEHPGTGERAPFHDIHELRSALARRPAGVRSARSEKRTARKVADP